MLEASVDYYYPNHPEVEFEKDFNIQYDVNNILNKYGHTEMGMYKIQLYVEKILGGIQFICGDDIASLIKRFENESK